jgi:hypothetical protein
MYTNRMEIKGDERGKLGCFLSSLSYKRWMDGWMKVIVKMVEGGEGVSGFSRDWNPTSC